MFPIYTRYIGTITAILGDTHYLINTARGRTKPNKVTWFFWGIAPLIAFFAQKQNGVGSESLFTLGVSIAPLLIFIVSFINPQAYWKLTKLDIVMGVTALLSFTLWQVTGNGLVAVIFAVLTDFFASIPTVIKAWSYPETETITPYITGVIGATFILTTITSWKLINYLFPLYIAIICTIIALTINLRRTQKNKH